MVVEDWLSKNELEFAADALGHVGVDSVADLREFRILAELENSAATQVIDTFPLTKRSRLLTSLGKRRDGTWSSLKAFEADFRAAKRPRHATGS